jgi:putative transposase
MPRPPRLHPDGVPQHIVNRGNRKTRIFWQPADYLGFIGAMAAAAEGTVVRLVAFCLLPNHWHLVLWPYKGAEISTYMQLLMNAHLRDLLPRNNLVGLGHVYQGRYRRHLIHNERHFLNVCRYVESNARRANLCERAEQWEWSSLSISGPAPGINLLSDWPISRPADWLDQVNSPLMPRPDAREWLPVENAGHRQRALPSP